MDKKILAIVIFVVGIVFIFLTSISDLFLIFGLLLMGIGIYLIYKFEKDKKDATLKNANQNKSSFDTSNKNLTSLTKTHQNTKVNIDSLDIAERNNNRKQYEFKINTKDYTSERIEEVIKEYIDNDYYEKDELYEGYSNSDIEDIGDSEYKIYQLDKPSFDGNVKAFADSNTYGVYIGTILNNDLDIIKNILFYGKNISCSIDLTGGKYKIYDDNDSKVITKHETYVPILNISCSYIDNNDNINKNIILEDKEDKLYKLYVTKIVGTTFENENGEKRSDILKNVAIYDQLKLEQFYYNSKKAVKILTGKGELIGFISANEAETIYDLIEEDKIYKAYYYPVMSVSEVLNKRIKILIKK